MTPEEITFNQGMGEIRGFRSVCLRLYDCEEVVFFIPASSSRMASMSLARCHR